LIRGRTSRCSEVDVPLLDVPPLDVPPLDVPKFDVPLLDVPQLPFRFSMYRCNPLFSGFSIPSPALH
jgi:hypothetical protein